MFKNISKYFIKNFKNEELIIGLNPLNFSISTQYDKKEYNTQNDLKWELLDPEQSSDVQYVYYKGLCKNYDNLLFESSMVRFDLFVISSKFVGREYAKTHGLKCFSPNFQARCLFEVYSGAGYFLIEDESKDDIDIIKIKQGERVLIGKDKIFTIINSSDSQSLVCGSLVCSDCEFEKGRLRNSCGNKVFLTNKGFIKNKNVSPMYKLSEFEGDFLCELSFDKNKDIYMQFRSFPEKFNFLKG